MSGTASTCIAQCDHSTETIRASMRGLRKMIENPDDEAATPDINRQMMATHLNTLEAAVTELASRRGPVGPVRTSDAGLNLSNQADHEFVHGVAPVDDDDIPFGRPQPLATSIDAAAPGPRDVSPHDPGDEAETPAERAETLRRLDANEIHRLRELVDHQRFVLAMIHSFAHVGRECTTLDSSVMALNLIELEASYELGKRKR